jgi:MATE family multidrug resistance protein
MFAPDTDAGRLVEIGTVMLVMSALWQVFDAIGITLAETLRAAGDTEWTAKLRIALAWIVFTPTAYLVVKLGGGPVGAMVCMIVYLALIAVALALRFRTGAWRRIELIEPVLA